MPSALKNQFFWAVLFSVVLCLDLTSQGLPSQAAVDVFRFVRQGVLYFLLNIIYLIWLVRHLKQESRTNQNILDDSSRPGQKAFWQFLQRSKPYLIFPVLAFLAFGQNRDTYLYLQYGLMALKGINPLLNPTDSLRTSVSDLLVWFLPSTYGPSALLTFVAAAPFAAWNVVAGVYAFKAICLLLHLLNTYLVWMGLQKEKLQTFITTSYLIHPVLLFELVVQVHIDILLTTAALLLILALRSRRYALAILAIWLGLLSKVVPIVWLPLTVTFLVRDRRWKALAVSLLCSIGLVALLSFTLLPGTAWIGLLHPGATWTSAGSIHQIWAVILDGLQPVLPISRNKLFIGFKLLTYLAYCIYYAWLMLRVLIKPTYQAKNLISDLGWATLALFLLASSWYQPWYATVLLPFAALNFRDRFAAIVYLTFAVCSSCSYYLLAAQSVTLPLLLVSLITIVPTVALLCYRKQVLLKLNAFNQRFLGSSLG